MNKNISQLESEWQKIANQLNAAIADYYSLRRMRSDFQVKFIFPDNDSTESLDEFHRREQQAIAEFTVNLQHLDQDIKGALMKVKNIQATMAVKQSQLYQAQAKIIWEKLIKKSQKINQLSHNLQTEIKAFNEIAKEFSPSLTKTLPQPPLLVKVSSATVPHVVNHQNRLEIKDRDLNDINP